MIEKEDFLIREMNQYVQDRDGKVSVINFMSRLCQCWRKIGAGYDDIDHFLPTPLYPYHHLQRGDGGIMGVHFIIDNIDRLCGVAYTTHKSFEEASWGGFLESSSFEVYDNEVSYLTRKIIEWEKDR